MANLISTLDKMGIHYNVKTDDAGSLAYLDGQWDAATENVAFDVDAAVEQIDRDTLQITDASGKYRLNHFAHLGGSDGSVVNLA